MIRIFAGNNAHSIVKYAALELRNYIRLIFEKEADIILEYYAEASSGSEKESNHTDPAFVLNVSEMEMNGQGFLIRKVDENKLYITGGSSEAVLWGVYELAGRWGVVYSLKGDILPEKRSDFILPDMDEKFEPLQRDRIWRLFNDLIIGPICWSLEQQKRVILQLVKQKYNGILFSVWPLHPFINFAVNGISRKTATMNFGMKIPVTKENIGIESLYTTDNYINPVFEDCHTFEEWNAAATSYVSEIMEYAKSFNMKIILAFQPFDFNPEYGPLLEKPAVVNQVGGTLVYESGNLFNENHIALLRTQFEAYLNTFPLADLYQINLPEHGRNASDFASAWESLDARFGLSSKYDIESMLYDEIAGNITAGGPERAVNEGRMTIVMLDTLLKLLDKTRFLSKLQKAGKRLSVTAGLSCPGIIPVIADCLWPDAHLALIMSYTSSRSVRNIRFVDGIDTRKIHIDQTITLQDDNIGAMPQIATRSISYLLQMGIDNGFNGYCTRFWPIGDLDPVSEYISKASWDNGATPERVYENYIGKLYGEKCIRPYTNALNLMEDATVLLDVPLNLIFPGVKVMADKMGRGSVLVKRAEYWHIAAIYEEVRRILEKNSDVRPEAKRHLDYWMSRVEFGKEIILGVLEICNGNNELETSRVETARAAYSKAILHFREALGSIAANVMEDSDKGILAVYYQGLVRELEEKLADIE